MALGLCLVAALRVCIWSAAFPFFNNVDEQTHFDLVLKYSRGHVPRQLEPMSKETAHFVALYGSSEYTKSARDFPNGVFPPPRWRWTDAERADLLARMDAAPLPINPESSQAPLYYAAASLWMRLGRGLGMHGGFLLYWIRFLNIALFAALVWLGYVVARAVYPDVIFARLGVPLLLAVLPQDAFFSIQSDVLSPLCFGLAVWGLVRWFGPGVPRTRLGILIGLALAAVGLTKISNLPLLVVAVAALLIHAWRSARPGWFRAARPAVAGLALSAGLPLAGFVTWNINRFGDVTASAAKIRSLGWTRKPPAEWFHHPMFSPHGLWFFWSQLLARFWRGEFVWGSRPLASPVADAFYWISPLAFLAAAILGLARNSAPSGEGPSPATVRRQALRLSLACFLACVGYLAFLSILFDFGGCAYPSRAVPFFTSGRLMSGALIPFFLLYVEGLGRVTARLRLERFRWWILAGIALFVLGAQIAVDRVAFSSPYNLYHLLGAR